MGGGYNSFRKIGRRHELFQELKMTGRPLFKEEYRQGENLWEGLGREQNLSSYIRGNEKFYAPKKISPRNFFMRKK